ncbi:MAG: 4-oxalocrotonate tautomerase family protein [Bacteroidales bacterium]|jgi:4-oxalocrotonate tautomerase|nr:4-oxalocrotonate tautomerase family protein [Bacteroidales bacterium]
MPVITLDVAPLGKEQKAKLSKEMTDLAAEVLNMPKHTIYVFFREYELDSIGVGGELLSKKNKPETVEQS